MKQSIARIVKVRTIYGVESLAEAFPKELRMLEIEDILEPNVSMDLILQKIQAFFPHSVVMKQETNGHKSYMFMEFELQLGEHILMRKDKLLGAGSSLQMKGEFLDKINGEYPGKFSKISVEEVDDDWIKSFCQMHYNNQNFFRIINIE